MPSSSAARAGYHPAWRYPLGRTDLQGQFEFRGMNSVNLLGAVSETLGTSPFLLLAGEVLEGDSTRPLTLTLPGTAGSVLGHVLLPDGVPAEDAVVLVFYGLERVIDSEGRSWSRPPSATTRTDASGAFALGGLLPEVADLVVMREGLATYARRIRLDQGPLTGQTVLLEGGATVEGRITDERGQPISGQYCRAVTVCGEWWPYHASAAEDGTFRIEHLPSGSCRLEITSLEHATWRRELELTDSGSYQVNAVLTSKAQQRCRLVDAEGQPLAGWRFDAESRSWARTDQQGYFDLPMHDGRRKSLSVIGGQHFGPIIHTFGPIQAQPALLTLTVPAESMPSAWIAGRLLDSEGEPLVHVEITITQWGIGATIKKNWMDSGATDASGAFRIGPLPPGRYSLTPRHAILAFPTCEVVVGVDQEHDFGSIRGVPSASLPLILAAFSSGDPAEYVLLDEQGRVYRPRKGRTPSLVFPQLLPGTYRVAVIEGDSWRVPREVNLLPGDVQKLRLAR